MSHVVKIDMQILDLDALAATAKALGLELVRGQQTYRWYGRVIDANAAPEGFTADDLGKCEHALRLKGANPTAHNAPYEIGVVRRRDGKPGYTLLWDFFMGGYGLQEKVGQNGNRLKQEYPLQVATRLAIRRGLRVTRTVNKEDGRIVLRARR